MEPRQLAALLGTEVDTGFAAALSRLGASRALVVESIRTRVGAVPDGGEDTQLDWSQIPWVADVTLQPVDPLPAAPTEPGTATDPPSGRQDVRDELAALAVTAIRGVGHTWASRLQSWGITRVGDLADADTGDLMRLAGPRIPALVVLLARARTLVAPWPGDLPGGGGRSIADLATSLPGAHDVEAFVLREQCMSLLACLDLDVAKTVSPP